MMDYPIPILENIFSLQEKVLRKNISEFKDRYDFILACIDLAGTPAIPPNSWKKLSDSKRIVFNYFHGDALSTLINAIRLGFQGCETDAYALMRVVLENLTILQYIVKFDLYDKAYSEIKNRAQRGKLFSKTFSYNTAVKRLGIMDRRERAKGDFSNLGNHVSPSRLWMSRFEIGDTDYAKIGASINNPRTKNVIGELASLALFLIKITDDFLMSCVAENESTFHKRRIEMEKLYNDLKKNQTHRNLNGNI